MMRIGSKSWGAGSHAGCRRVSPSVLLAQIVDKLLARMQASIPDEEGEPADENAVSIVAAY